jgi:hypothetical protein
MGLTDWIEYFVGFKKQKISGALKGFILSTLDNRLNK